MISCNILDSRDEARNSIVYAVHLDLARRKIEYHAEEVIGVR